MPSSIRLHNVNVSFKIYNARSRGLLNTVLGAASASSRISATATGVATVHALRDINLSLNDGDRLGIIGPNGAGKTTLLRVLSGVYEPVDQSGQVDIVGQVSSLTDTMLGMDGEATGFENIRLRANILGLSRSRTEALRRDVIEFTELGPYLELPLRTYSSGMALKFAFAIATAVLPDILIMDELIGAGDERFRAKAAARIDSFVSSVRIAVIASHDLGVIRKFCNRAILMQDGKIVVDGGVDEVISRYLS